MAQDFSKENQSSVETTFRFGEFELDPSERRLTRAGTPVALQPKAFDALLCLVRRAQHLVSKQELMAILWPSVHVSEANLTNIIVNLRKIIGRESLRTVSKYGYRFELPVSGEPGVSRATFERFARARELTTQRSVDSMNLARDYLWICLAESPSFAPAWAWLGRCCWFLGKFSGHRPACLDLAHAAFARAFALDPHLAVAHQFYTLVQVDSGHAREAVSRLLDRLQVHPGEPESLAGLVQALRFRGLIDLSLEAHRRAIALDPAVVTSCPHTLFVAGEYAAAIEAYGGRGAYYLDCACWAALGDSHRAVQLLHQRLRTNPLSPLMTALMTSLLAILEGNPNAALFTMQKTDATLDPEVQFYFARHYSRLGQSELGIDALRQAARSGFICAPATLQSDTWLSAVREHPEFPALLEAAKQHVEDAHTALAHLLTI